VDGGRKALGLVVALDAEERVARLSGCPVVCAGVGPDRALSGAKALIETGAQALVSFGVAGALTPQAGAGMLLIPNRLYWNDRVFEMDARLGDSLRSSISPSVQLLRGGHVAVGEMIRTRERKAELARKHEHAGEPAFGVDMESGAIAQAAAGAGIPFAVLRVVADEANVELSDGVCGLLDGDGSASTSKALRLVLRQPAACVELARIGISFWAALRTLKATARALGDYQLTSN
jgi:adenosylhomocysteine nucleosidase